MRLKGIKSSGAGTTFFFLKKNLILSKQLTLITILSTVKFFFKIVVENYVTLIILCNDSSV